MLHGYFLHDQDINRVVLKDIQYINEIVYTELTFSQVSLYHTQKKKHELK